MRALGWAWMFIAILVSCTASDDTREWTGAVETLANGAIRVNNPAEGLWTPESAWRLVPETVIGELDGEDPYIFAAISGLAVNAIGQIFALDRETNELRIFNPTGEHIRTTGRKGEGPGEYSNANGLAWLSDDTIVVVDQPGNRYSVLSSSGDFVRSVPRNLGFYGWVYSGGIQDSELYESSYVGQDEDFHPALLGTRLRRPDLPGLASFGEPPEPGAPQAAIDTIMLPEPSGPIYESFSVRTERGGMVMGVPHAARPIYSLDGEGHIWFGHGGTPTVYRGTFEGETLSEIAVNWTPHPVTDEEVAEWAAGESVQRFRDMGGDLDLHRIPASKPFFDDIVIAEDGHVWLTVPAGVDETVFAVLDPDGRYLGQLTLSNVARVDYVRPVIRNDRVFFVGTDEIGVQRIYVYKVER
jgi:hypothetical protein